MTLLPPDSLDKVLRAQNPWWGASWVSGVPGLRGSATQPRGFDSALTSDERALLLLGPCRAGKTAALLRVVETRLRAGTHRGDLGYVDLDHALLRFEALGPLVDRVIRLMEPKERPWILLDGLQALPDWPARFAELLSTRPQAHFIASSSIAPGDANPDYDTVRVPPFRFREVCALRGLPDLGAPALDLVNLSLPDQADPADDYLFHRVLEPLLADYLVRGGFPDSAAPADSSLDLAGGRAAVRHRVVARAIYQDLPSVVHVTTQADLERVLLATLIHGSDPIHVEAFSDSLGLESKTLGRYHDHLERAFLLTELRNFAATTERSRPRLHPTDPALPNAFLERGTELLADPLVRRELLAGAVVSHVADYATARGYDLAYYREGDVEADLVLVTPDGALPILLIDSEEIGDEEATRVDRLLRKTHSRRAIVLSRARPRRREALTFFEAVDHIPAAYFLYAIA